MNPSNVRYHALDSMRASMMLMGIYLHVVVGYSGDGHWPYIDPHPSTALSFTLGIIHSFRMPAFYVMAGFFGALLWNGRGPASFVNNRVKRVLIPFAVFWAFLFPLMATIVISLEKGTQFVIPAFLGGAVLQRLHPLHLWFLEYLLILYAIGGAVAWLSRWFPAGLIERIHTAYRWALQKPYAPALFALFSWLQLASMRGNLKDCDGFTPELPILLAYIPPFTFGWLLYTNRDLLDRFKRHVWIYLTLAVPAFLVYGLVPGGTHPYIKAAGNVLLCWFNIFVCTGLFLKLCSEPSPRWRYMSDASYWLFIMHMPVVVGLQVALMPLPLPALAKVPIVLALSVAILLASYDLMVRPTWIGVLLNGRRYPRRLPVISPQPAPSMLDSRPEGA
ncbi:MAG: acyltransferase family protein [Acidobacteria bacterium]|nr:acyltransferase family protein [Acidobacteriota bacterium]